LGFERWANLPPLEYRLQSFGHASVDSEGNLEIKLIGIDGDIKLEKKLAPPTNEAAEAPQDSGHTLALIVVTVMMVACTALVISM
jgi:hypothetical protein